MEEEPNIEVSLGNAEPVTEEPEEQQEPMNLGSLLDQKFDEIFPSRKSLISEDIYDHREARKYEQASQNLSYSEGDRTYYAQEAARYRRRAVTAYPSALKRIASGASSSALKTQEPSRKEIPEEDLKVLEAVYHQLIPRTSRSKGSLTRIINNYRKHFLKKEKTNRLFSVLKTLHRNHD